MRLSVLQAEFKRALSVVSHAVAGRSSLPVLSNILLEGRDGQLVLTATNLEIGIQHSIPVRLDTWGSTTLPAKLLSDVVGSLPNDRINMGLDDQTLTMNLKCGRFETNIKGIDIEEFPLFPQFTTDTNTAVFQADVLRDALNRVVFAAATEDTRPILAGVHIRLEKNTAVLTTADGFRLARRTINLPQPVDSCAITIPAKALNELARIISGDAIVKMTATDALVLFQCGATTLHARLIDGKFPDVDRAIPTSYDTHIIADKKELQSALRLASYFANTAANVVRISTVRGPEDTPGWLTLTANAAELGDNKSELNALVAGKDTRIALNAKYLAAAIDAVTTPQVAIELQGEKSPAVVKPVGDDSYIHVVMPMTIR